MFGCFSIFFFKFVTFRKIFSFLVFGLSVLVPFVAYAAGSVFDSSACNTLNIVMGTPGKVFAAFAVVSTGVGFFSGKVSWGLCLGVVGGIAVIFGAPSVVAAISGEPMFECQQGVQYVSDCEGSSCYSCPMGFTGQDCDRCATGYSGANCDSCADGYTGYNCSECDSLSGYYSAGNYCFKACVVNFKGIISRAIEPTSGPTLIDCNDTGFAGSVEYTCINEVFEVTPGEACGCEGNRGGVDCDECQPGYDLSTNCTNLLPGYYDTPDGPHPECDVSSEVELGVDFSALASVLPLDGTLGCSVLGYDGSLDYSCESGVFAKTGSCACAVGYGGGIDNCAASCDTSSGYDRDVATGECRRGCDISIPGSTQTWVQETNVDETLLCDAGNFNGDMVYSCDPSASPSFVIVEDNCQCDVGYEGVDCLSCDAANGYSDDGSGNCIAGCTIDIPGSDVVWVSPTTSSLQIPCNETNYEGDINYTCANNNFSTTDSCSCVTGYDVTNNCATCDVSSGYKDDGSGNCLAGCNIGSIDPLISDSWVAEGSSTLTCATAPDGFSRTITVSCSANSASITSPNTSCVCPVGYSGVDCTSCDTANGYSNQGGVCKSGCYVNMAGIAVNHWVNKTTSPTQLTCSVGNYEGILNYICDGVSFTTSDSCSCKVGYAGADCNSCDSANNYAMISGSCQKSCNVPTGIADMQIPSGGMVVQGSGSFSCSASSVAGINNRSSIGYSCDGNGNISLSQSSCACPAGYTGSDCSQIDSANGYIDDGSGNPILTCNVSLTGITETYVTLGSNILNCSGNYQGTISYDCDANRNLNESGSCSCATGYTGSGCSTCASGYNMDGGVCKQQCSITGVTGVANGEMVDSGSNRFNCNETGYVNDITYSCDNGAFTLTTNNCELQSCSGGSESNVGVNDKVHIFTSNEPFTCPRNISNARILVVGGGGSGGGHGVSGKPGGGGGGGVVYSSSTTINSGSYSVIIGNGGSGIQSGRGNNGSYSRFSGGSITMTANGGGGGAGAGNGSGQDGGSGGGQHCDTSSWSPGSATKGSSSGVSNVSLYGNSGGTSSGCTNGGGGGGGASQTGLNASGTSGGNGGQGFTTDISGTSNTYGSGGGGAGTTGGSGGTNGGNGSSSNKNGINYTGGGGGGHTGNVMSGSGGKGVVIIRYTNN